MVGCCEERGDKIADDGFVCIQGSVRNGDLRLIVLEVPGRGSFGCNIVQRGARARRSSTKVCACAAGVGGSVTQEGSSLTSFRFCHDFPCLPLCVGHALTSDL